MVLGLRSKHRRGPPVKVNYTVHVQEIRPWPPAESLRSVQTLLLQWENGSHYSGSFLSTTCNSKIVFNNSFKLPLILIQDNKAHDKYQKNILEFSLFLPPKDKSRGQLLGTALLNLADYGVIERVLIINVPVNLKKSSRNSMQPALVISLEPVDKDSSNSSHYVGLSKETSLDDDNDDMEIAYFTDDDASSHSSRAAGSSKFEVGTSSPTQIENVGKNGYGYAVFEPEQKMNRQTLSIDASSDTGNLKNDSVSFSKFYKRSMTSAMKNTEGPVLGSSLSSISNRDVKGKANTIIASCLKDNASLNSDEAIAKTKHKATQNIQESVEGKSSEELKPEAVALSADNYGNDANKFSSLYFHATQEKKLAEENEHRNDSHDGLLNIEKREQMDNESDGYIMEKMRYSPKTKVLGSVSADATGGQVSEMNEKQAGVSFPSSNEPRLKHVKPVQRRDSLDLGMPDGSPKKSVLGAIIRTEEPRKAELSDCNNEWKTRVEVLEEELREAAAAEVGLYSVVAEHASSSNKVHTPARRLSRFYNNACKAGCQAKRASAARAAVSGLVLVSKSCGNDVPRLTFWLSNAIMLRATVCPNTAQFPNSDIPERKLNGNGISESDEREDVSTFIIALEKVESWLFSRIVESLWWQTFTPNMQPTIAKVSEVTSDSGTEKTCGRRNSVGNDEQGNFSTELWKRAFKDACERLCPLRAGGHKCGCLSVLVRLVMEKLVDRLDTAMFNAILRESEEEMPTDPLSDPISDSKVLPIPAGKSSFGAGVELKNSIRGWSIWLTDLFGLEDDSIEHSDVSGDGKAPKSFKAFRLLHALSDLMMLPFGILADASSRKEVCPMFGPAIISRVLSSYVADEFCPDPVPQNIIDSLEKEEDVSEASGDLLTSIPCIARPTKYVPPPAALLTCVGEVGSQLLRGSRLSTLGKSYNSDDELEEHDSPFMAIVPDSLQSSALAKLGLIAKEKGGRNVLRYQLLREVWADDEY